MVIWQIGKEVIKMSSKVIWNEAPTDLIRKAELKAAKTLPGETFQQRGWYGKASHSLHVKGKK
jgi:hypothetical protein